MSREEPQRRRPPPLIPISPIVGRMKFKGDKVIHHIEVSSLLNWIGVDQERFFEVEGDSLLLRNPPLLLDGIQRTS